MDPIIIIGTGLAGYNLAKNFRKLDKTTPLIMLSLDDGTFYSKPLLSTGISTNKEKSDYTIFTKEQMSAQLNANILNHTKVKAINSEENSITLENNDILNYSKLVLALGATFNKIPLTTDCPDLIFSINNLEDYLHFKSALNKKKRILIIGSGLVGSEYAFDLKQAGLEVSVVALDKYPMERFLPKQCGTLIQKELESIGVAYDLNTSINKIEKLDNGIVATLSNNKKISADIALMAVGIKANLDLVKNTNIKNDKGIIVDEFLTTSINNIYALGDCVEVNNHTLHFITPLMKQALALANTLAGNNTAIKYPPMPIVAKIPSLHNRIFLPQDNAHGEWQYEGKDKDLIAKFIGKNGELLGLVLMGETTKQVANYMKQLPTLI